MNTDSVVKTLNGHSSLVITLTQLSNGNLVSGSADSTIKIWNLENGSLLNTLTAHTSSVISLLVLSNGNLLSGSNDGTIREWNLNTFDLLNTHPVWGYSKLSTLPSGHFASLENDSIRIYE